ncbi:MAG: DUF502 domain-containing protein [Candidatus Omnitrophica bacterium]|nr:DUF502 domain-containing protein [Candidatus Omnitrophota bacterium]
MRKRGARMPATDLPQAHQRVRLTTRLRRYFLTGLATLFPAVVTLYLLLVVFRFADGLLGRFINRYWLATYGYEIPGLGLVMTVLLILATGILSSHLFGQFLFRGMEAWFGNLPFVRRIYQPVKQLAKFLFEKSEREAAFRRVVLVQYPRAGAYSIAFVTNEAMTTATGSPKTLLTILIPNPPSPFTGPIIFVPKEEVIPLEMSVEEAVRLIVSGGVVASPLRVAERSTPA